MKGHKTIGLPGLGLLGVAVLVLVSGCSTYPTRSVSTSFSKLERSKTEIADSQLLDVRVEIFNPGKLPESEDASRGLSDDIRNAEALYVSTHLKDTLERSGYWGAVRVVPPGTLGTELAVSGTILESDGEKLALMVTARDSRDAHWFTKRYERVVSEKTYQRAAKRSGEVFQGLYNEISNDLVAYRADLADKDLTTVRQVAELRFARSFAPSMFEDFLSRGDAAGGSGASSDASKVYRVNRLPSADNPMMERVRRIRGRDYLLVDTLDAQYHGVYRDLKGPYTAWREARLAEVNTIREVERESNERMATGVAIAVLGALAGAAANSSSTFNTSGGGITAVAVTLGAQRMLSAADMREQATINLEAMSESGESFTTEVEPYITEVEGETVRLVGTAETMYAQWRDVLKRIYEREFGFLPQTPASSS